MVKRPTGRPVLKVRIDDGKPRDVATLRLAWGVIDRAFAQQGAEAELTWGIEAFDGCFHRETMNRQEWRAFARGPLAFQQLMETMSWQDRGLKRLG